MINQQKGKTTFDFFCFSFLFFSSKKIRFVTMDSDRTDAISQPEDLWN